jgi:DNA-binding cell septation regulator SpoVG
MKLLEVTYIDLSYPRIPSQKENNLVAYANITLADQLSIRSIKLIQSPDGTRFLVFPDREVIGKTDEKGKPIYRDLVHPTKSELREYLTEAVCRVYDAQNPSKAPKPPVKKQTPETADETGEE